MWTRKSDLEIKNFLLRQEKEKQSLRRPIIFGTGFGLLFMLLQYLGFRGGSRGFYVFASQTGFSLRTIFFGVSGFLLFFFLGAYHQRRGSSFFSGADALLCGECKEPSAVNTERRCECGGKLEPFEYYSWEG